MNFYYRIQLMTNNQSVKVMPDEKEISKQAEALAKFCDVFQIHYHRHQIHTDLYYLLAPEDAFEFAHLANAINAFCFVHHAVWQMSSEKVTVPFDQFLQNLSKEKFD